MLGRSFDPLHVPDEIEIAKGLTLGGNYIRVAQTIRTEDAMDRFPGAVLLIHGSADDVVPLEDSRAAEGRYRNCRLEILEGETHHFDRFPEKMQAVIRDWLAGRRES